MRFSIATADRYKNVFEAFVGAGWEPVKLFTVPVKNEFSNNRAVISYAETHNAPIQISRITERDLIELHKRGCDALVVASYDWKVPDWSPYLRYAVNFHPSPLPYGRGPYPVVRAILEEWDHWAVTCHRLSPLFDRGHVLATQEFVLSKNECHESLDLKIQMAAKKLAVRTAGQFVHLWENATPQENGSYWPKPTMADRIIDFQKPVDRILRQIRAFGRAETFAKIADTWFVVKGAIGWVEVHQEPPGKLVHVFNRSSVVAALDGYVGLIDFGIAPPQIVAQINSPSPRA